MSDNQSILSQPSPAHFASSFLTLHLVTSLCFLPILHHFHPLSSLRFSDGPDLLEGDGADGHGADGVSGRPAVPVPAQHHHRDLHGLPRRHVFHHLSAHLLPTPLCPQLGRRRAPLQVRMRTAGEKGKKTKGHNSEMTTRPIQSQFINTCSEFSRRLFQSYFNVLRFIKNICLC